MKTADRDRLQLALAAAELGEWWWDAATDVVTFSGRAAEIYDIEPGPVLTWARVRELLHPDDREPARLAVEAAITNHVDYIIEYRLINGERERWIAVSGRAQYDAEDRAVGMMGFVHDRTGERLLAALDELLRPLSDARSITHAAGAYLGRALNVDRCAYATVESDEDSFTIVGDYVRGMRSVVGRYRFADFGAACLRLLRAGQAFVVSDRRHDSRIEAKDHAAYDRIQMEAVICVSVHKAGRFVAAMAVHSATPRMWSRQEVELLRAVASRCWESLERARVEQTLRENEERYQALLQTAGQLVWTADPDGRVTKDSRSWRAFTGQSEAEWAGEGWLDALHPDDRRLLKELWPSTEQHKEPVNTEYRVRHRDGTWRWTSVRIVPITHADGSIREWFGMNADITARKLTERRDAFLVRLDDATRPLTEPAEIAETVLRLLCEELGADRGTYFEIDDDGFAGTVLADYAPRLCALQGIYPLEEYGVDFASAVRSGSVYRLEDVSQADLDQAERDRFDAIQIRAELMVPLHKAGKLKATLGLFQGAPRNWQADEIQLCHLVVQRCWDSLERARIERGVRLADQRKDEFIATLAHELRNPLAPIRNGLSILKKSGQPEVRLRTETMMERHVEHLVRMVDELVDISRINRGMIELRPSRVVLQEALSHAVDAVRPVMQHAQHAFALDVVGEPVWISGDPVRLTQIFSNLLNNAAKFTPAGGRIRVSLSIDDGQALIAVEDNGIGIDSSMLNEIFETFAQGQGGRAHAQGGLGIGLSLVRRLVALHGGQVSAHSEGADCGSRFEVRLPLPGAAALAPVSASDPASGVVGGSTGRERVLVVDDNRDAADSLAELLRVLGWDVVATYDGPSALRAIEHERFDVALLDLGMPGMDGYQLARNVREQGASQLTLVALTGWGQEQDRARSQSAGFDHHLVKPVELDALTKIIQSHFSISA